MAVTPCRETQCDAPLGEESIFAQTEFKFHGQPRQASRELIAFDQSLQIDRPHTVPEALDIYICKTGEVTAYNRSVPGAVV